MYSWIENNAVIKFGATGNKKLFASLFPETGESIGHCGVDTIKLALKSEYNTNHINRKVMLLYVKFQCPALATPCSLLF